MQHLYAYFQDGAVNNTKFQLELNNSIYDVYNAYVYILLTLKEIVNYAVIDAEIRKKKFIPTQEDLNISIKIINNSVVQSLFNSSSFILYCKQQGKKIKNFEYDTEIIRSEYYKLIKNPIYKKYCDLSDPSEADNRGIIVLLAKSLLSNSNLLDNYITKFCINWQYDKAVVSELVLKTIKKPSPELISLVKHPENITFAINLFNMVANNYNEYDEIIKSKSINWDFKRILLLDKILIRMAISEFKNFDSIPAITTIDEYLTISKQFSSSKSYIFINGILDKVLKEINDIKNEN